MYMWTLPPGFCPSCFLLNMCQHPQVLVPEVWDSEWQAVVYTGSCHRRSAWCHDTCVPMQHVS